MQPRLKEGEAALAKSDNLSAKKLAAYLASWDIDENGKATGGHDELSSIFVQAAGIDDSWTQWLWEGSRRFDAWWNQLSVGHAMKNNRYEDFTNGFRKEYTLAQEFLQDAEKTEEADKKKMYERQAYMAFGRACHIVGDYRAHYMRAEDTGFIEHFLSLGSKKKSPDSPHNNPNLFRNAREAVQYLGVLYKTGAKEIDNATMERLFPKPSLFEGVAIVENDGLA